MSVKKIHGHECHCERCGHNWRTRHESLPEVCARCKSPYWNKSRIRNKA